MYSLREGEHLNVRNMSKAIQLNKNINENSVHFVGSHYLCVSQRTVQKTLNLALKFVQLQLFCVS